MSLVSCWRQHVDVLRELACARLEHARFGLDRARRDLASSSGNTTLVRPCASASSRATRAAMAPRRSRTSPNSDANLVSLMRIRGWPCCTIVAFLNQDFVDDAAFQRLDDLDLSRGNDAAVAALDLVEDREMRPDQADDEQRECREQEHARRPRRAQLDRRADVVGEGEIRLLHGSTDLTVRLRCLGLRPGRRLQHRDDLVARSVGDQAALVEHQQPIDQGQQRRAGGSK